MIDWNSERTWQALTLLAIVLIVFGWVPIFLGSLDPSIGTYALLMLGMALGVLIYLRNRAASAENAEE